MASPFPGMDPYLEDSEYWRGFHNLFTAELLRQLNPLITPKYYADIEVHAVLDEIGIAQHHVFADSAILETWPPQPGFPVGTIAVPIAPIQREVKIPEEFKLRTVRVHRTDSKQLVTSIEILSPANKSSSGLRKYQQKRARIMRSDIHLVEIDLLRGGERPGREVNEPPLDTDYVMLVNRAISNTRRISDIWPVAINEPLPKLPIPLLLPDPDVVLALGEIFHHVYADACYALRIDYKQPVPPPELRPAMKAWLANQPR